MMSMIRAVLGYVPSGSSGSGASPKSSSAADSSSCQLMPMAASRSCSTVQHLPACSSLRSGRTNLNVLDFPDDGDLPALGEQPVDVNLRRLRRWRSVYRFAQVGFVLIPSP